MRDDKAIHLIYLVLNPNEMNCLILNMIIGSSDNLRLIFVRIQPYVIDLFRKADFF